MPTKRRMIRKIAKQLNGCPYCGEPVSYRKTEVHRKRVDYVRDDSGEAIHSHRTKSVIVLRPCRHEFFKEKLESYVDCGPYEDCVGEHEIAGWCLNPAHGESDAAEEGWTA